MLLTCTSATTYMVTRQGMVANAIHKLQGDLITLVLLRPETSTVHTSASGSAALPGHPAAASAEQTTAAAPPAARARPSSSRFCFAKTPRNAEGTASLAEAQGALPGHVDASAPAAVPAVHAPAGGGDSAAAPLVADLSASSHFGFPAADTVLPAGPADAASLAGDLPDFATGLVPGAVSPVERSGDIKLGSTALKGTAGRPVFKLTANAVFQLQPSSSDSTSCSSESSTTPAPTTSVSISDATTSETQAEVGTGDAEGTSGSDEGSYSNPTQAVFASDPGASCS